MYKPNWIQRQWRRSQWTKHDVDGPGMITLLVSPETHLPEVPKHQSAGVLRRIFSSSSSQALWDECQKFFEDRIVKVWDDVGFLCYIFVMFLSQPASDSLSHRIWSHWQIRVQQMAPLSLASSRGVSQRRSDPARNKIQCGKRGVTLAWIVLHVIK